MFGEVIQDTFYQEIKQYLDTKLFATESETKEYFAQMLLSYKNQEVGLKSKLTDCFLYGGNIGLKKFKLCLYIRV